MDGAKNIKISTTFISFVATKMKVHPALDFNKNLLFQRYSASFLQFAMKTSEGLICLTMSPTIKAGQRHFILNSSGV